MSQNRLIGCSGQFSSVSFHDETLSEQFEISTRKSDGIGCKKNYRIVRVPFCDDSSRRFVAVSGYDEPYPVLVYDVNSQQQIANCLGHRNSVYGLTCLSSTVSSNPKIVSGGYFGQQVLVFDALEGTKLCELPDPPRSTCRILHVPEWNSHRDVFVGGMRSLFHYDLTRPDRKIGSFVGHSFRVWGLAANVTENILFSASSDKTVRLCSRNDYSCQGTINLSHHAWSCCFVEGRNMLIVGLEAGVIEFYDIRRLSDDVPVQTVKIASSGDIEDIIQIDSDRVVCGCGSSKSLVVCELPSGRVIHRTSLSAYVSGVCVFDELVSSGPGVLPNDELMRENEELRRIVEAKEREVEEKVREVEEKQQALDEMTRVKERETEELQRALQEKERESLGFQQTVQEKENEVSEFRQSLEGKLREIEELGRRMQEKESEFQQSLDGKVREMEELEQRLQEKDLEKASVEEEAEATLLRKETEILEIREELRSDGLSTRMRNFLRRLDSQRVSSLDLSERYRLRGCIDFREHILSSSDFQRALKSADGRFAFRDIWFGVRGREDQLSLFPFETIGDDEEEAGVDLLLAVETVVVDLFKDSSLAELLLFGETEFSDVGRGEDIVADASQEDWDEGTVSRDDILDLQEEWDGFFRVEAVYDTAKVMQACEASTHRTVSAVVSRIFDFFGGEVTDELVGRYNERFRVGMDCLLGSLESCGLGRHRSLCFKVACDRLGIPCRLIRGWRTCSVDGLTEFEQRSADAWCIVNLCDRLHFVDLVSTGGLLDKFHPGLSEYGKWNESEAPSIDLVQFGSEYPRLPKDLLGHGGFGQVFAVEFGDNFIAVKETNLTNRIAEEGQVASARVRRELNLMSSFNHPNIVPTCGSFEFVRRSVLSRRRGRPGTRRVHVGGSGSDGTIVGIVMPLYDRNAKVLREILREADSLVALRETLFLLLSVANGLRYLHSLSILHLDMKPDNVLLNIDEEQFALSDVRICDFGGSRPHCTLMSLSALPVSLGFCSPEVELAAKGDKTIVLDEFADVFSFGALMRFYNCYFGTFRQLHELCDRCLLRDRVLRPNLIEVMSILRSHLLFVDVKCCRIREEDE